MQRSREKVVEMAYKHKPETPKISKHHRFRNVTDVMNAQIQVAKVLP